MEGYIVDNMNVEEEFTAVWPEDVNEAGSQVNVDRLRADQDMLEEVAINSETSEADLEHLIEMMGQSEKGSSQLSYLVQHWEYKQANAVHLLREEVDHLSKQREEAELKRLEILEPYDCNKVAPKKKYEVPAESKGLEIDAEYDTVVYWKQRAVFLEKMLEESRQREQALLEKLEGSIKNMEKQSSPVQELSDILKRADNFTHFILQNAPIVLGHMDKELRYRFIYNHYPSFKEADIIGKTETEIFSGAGVKESLDFKREVLERGIPGKREITFETELFGSKTFLMYVEPVLNKARETIGINYIGMDITDQVKKRERMAKLQEEIAVQRATEIELNKTIHISGVMRLEATKFRPREVVRHVLQTAAASLRKTLTLEGHISDNVPKEVIGDVLRIRQILTNLISNAIKFTHEGKVGIRLYVVAAPCTTEDQKFVNDHTDIQEKQGENPYGGQNKVDEPKTPSKGGETAFVDDRSYAAESPHTVWIRCDVYDTGIGITEHALPTLLKKYMPASADHARKHGGRLAICKQLVELMGGHLTVSSKEHCGSTFTFELPYRVSSNSGNDSDDPDELPDATGQGNDTEAEDLTAGYFLFQPGTLGSSLFNSSRTQSMYGYSGLPDINPVSENASDGFTIPQRHDKIEFKEDSGVSSRGV